MSKTKIIATIGPVSSSPKMLEKLIKAGMNVARLNFSHGTHEEHLKVIKNIRQVSKKLKTPIAILQDLQGPKIRAGKFETGFTILKKGKEFTITTRNISGTDTIVGCTYKNLHKDVKKGNNILLNDGLLNLKVLKINGQDIITKVIVGGKLSNNKGINLPGINISEPALTAKDKKDLKFGIASDVDFVALSFVRHGKDIKEVTDIIKKSKSNIKVISKIEKPEGVKNIDEILNNSDGIMVARGDLGVEVAPESVPAIQKKLISLTSDNMKLVITATQMLESMIENPTPTRAEASDVANAIYDGTDAIMLSGETASGKYPVEAVKMMRKIATAAEQDAIIKKSGYFTSDQDNSATRAMCEAALLACEEINGKTIIVFTLSGNTARLIAKDKKDFKIIALTVEEKYLNQMALFWGITPMLMPYTKNSDLMIKAGIAEILKAKLVKKGEKVVILAGTTAHVGSTNMVKIETI